jgi:flagellar biosynthetic protein FliO
MESIFLRMVLSLCAVLALMVGVMYLVKRFLVTGAGPARMPVPVELLGKRSLQPKTSIAVVRVAGKVLVLGLSEHGVQTLTELTNEELQASLPVTSTGPGQPFSAYLHETLRTIRRGQKPGVAA